MNLKCIGCDLKYSDLYIQMFRGDSFMLRMLLNGIDIEFNPYAAGG